MPSFLPFSKYEGCGNDFILIDNRNQLFPTNAPELIVKLCHRRMGIGADGIIFLENSTTADFKMRIFNADGSEAEMCGNGIRCLLKYLRELGYSLTSYSVETMQRHLTVAFQGEDVSVEMGKPVNEDWGIEIPVHSLVYQAHYLNTGVPHVVIFVDDLESINVQALGSAIRWHDQFAPNGVNVNFAKYTDDGKFLIRTYERGVEAETLACGTGATAAAIAAAKVLGLKTPISVHTRSGEVLVINFTLNGDKIEDLTLCGPANHIFNGSIRLNLKDTTSWQNKNSLLKTPLFLDAIV